ncbi:MAG: proline dehydrogenase family protein [Lentimicrobium sp.]|nr:proline dehydrogenase family protein [Lentimicrobium sp.]
MTDLNFKNTEIAFKIKSNTDLWRSFLLFKIISFPFLVGLSKSLTSLALKLKIPISWIVKPTIYKHFVGGETISDCLPTVSRLNEFKVHSILDFSVEGSSNEEGINAALQETLRSIRNSASNNAIPFAVFKPTAFANQKLFENADPIKPMEGEMEKEYYRFRSRLNVLFDEAFKLNVPLMVDAEDSWYQYLVDDTIEEMMKRYNREKAIVYNTLQMYRTDRIEFLKNSIAKARSGNYFLGLKFVRGAYMEKERQRAFEKGYPSPIHADKLSTDTAFDEAIKISIENADIVSIFCGSHNETSNLKFAETIFKKKFDRKDNRFWFSQLYGMSDHISFNLAHAGFNVTKYIPYGPVKSVMPYLFRRAEENTSVSGQTSRELSLISSEIKRRKNK